ncbi:hypothetical protein CFter6_2420 [Collimonas fungivorans]|uniref:Uncharacterized protein n=1 Tax=Collimonas fungivorans TaxID=158899 RepID=A0A127PB91_9BURK|nr:hypothetical protein CFter6_2420 [Collimonas fungivorans]
MKRGAAGGIMHVNKSTIVFVCSLNPLGGKSVLNFLMETFL